MNRDKPFAPACERNRGPILEVLRRHFHDRRRVLEIGSGTGQHAVHFAAALPQLQWQTSDVAANLDGIRLWLEEAGLVNTPPPLALDVTGSWPDAAYDAVFTANTLHIMSWAQVEALFARLPSVMTPDAKLAVYGPFKLHGRHTSASNAAFDAALRRDVPHRGVRDLEAVAALAEAAGLQRLDDCALPANNRCVVWQRCLARDDAGNNMQPG